MDRREIRFDGWSVDFASGEISRDGNTSRLQDQPLQILDELTRNPGEVVTREQLIARLWPKGVVEFDTGLNSAVRKLRQALGDDPDAPRYIETLPRKGYRFIAHVESSAPASAGFVATDPVPRRRRASDRRAPIKRLAWGFGSIVAAIALAVIAWRMPGEFFQANHAPPPKDLPTIVVLPLVDMSLQQSEQALCDGLTEELSNWLAHIPTLRVVARTSAFAFQGQNIDVREIGRQLDATHVLEGSLRRSGDQLRITTQLIAADTGLHVWSRSFDLPIGDIFSIEDTVSRSVAEALHLTLAQDTTEQWAQRQPQKMEAYEFYLLGRARQRERTAEDNVKAAEFFRRAVAADPSYALAQVGLAETRLNDLSLNRAPLEDVAAEVEPLINRALALSPTLPDALAAKGWLLTEQFKFDEALPLLQRATSMNPNDAASHRFLGNLYDRRGEPNPAMSHFSIAAELDPLDFISHVFRCQELIDLAEFAQAGEACARARALDSTNLWGPLATAWLARAQGNTAEAIRWIDEARKLAPGDTWLADQKIELLLTLGRIDEARAVLREIPGDGSFFSRSREASVVVASGGPEALAEWMAKTGIARTAVTGAELAELSRLQFAANDPKAARATLAHAQRVLPHTDANLIDGAQIRHGYSGALVLGGIELWGGGSRERALAVFADLERLLTTYEKNGGKHFGVNSIRAEALALLGRKEEASVELQKAWDRGWRANWRAKRDPYFAGVKIPGAD